jgi:hypothetical protein
MSRDCDARALRGQRETYVLCFSPNVIPRSQWEHSESRTPGVGHGPKGGGLYRNVEIGLNRRYKPVLAGDFFCEPVLALLARTSSGPANDLSSCPARTPTSQLKPVPALLTIEFVPARTRLVDFVLSVCLSSPGDGCAPLVGHLFGAALCSSTYYDGNHQRHCELAPA